MASRRRPATEPAGRALRGSAARVRRRAGVRRARRWYRRPPAVVAAVLVLLIVAAGGGAAFVGKRYADDLQARVVLHLRSGAGALQAGRELVSKGNKERSPADLNLASDQFGAARREFRQAAAIATGDPLLQRAAGLPAPAGTYVGSRVSTLKAISDMGAALADAGNAAAETDALIIQPNPSGATGGKGFIQLIQTIGPQVDRVRTYLQQARAAADRVQPSLLPAGERGTFAQTEASIAAQLGGLEEYTRLAPVILEILGAGGARAYLIANADPAQLEASGGYVGSYSVMHTNQGEMKVDASGDVGAIDQPYPRAGQKGYVPPPSHLREYADHGWRLGDALVQPDLSVSGKTALDLYRNETGAQLDGLIVIDPYAVAMLLDVTGSINVPEYKTTVSGKDFAELVFQKEECRTCGNLYDGKKFISTVASHIIPALLGLSPGSWGNLLLGLNNAATQHHLQVYFANPAVEAEMKRLGWSGATVAVAGGEEYLREVENNYGDTKANHFIQRQYDLTLTSAADGRLRHHLVVSIKNSTPDGYSGGRHYRCYVRVYLSAAAADAHLDNVTGDRIPSDEALPAGLKMVDGWFQVNVDLARGFGAYQLAADWTTPAAEGGHRIYWQKQPGTLGDLVNISYVDRNGHTHRLSTDLAQDRVIDLGSDGVKVSAGQTGGASIPVIGS